jgi:alpha-amylase
MNRRILSLMLVLCMVLSCTAVIGAAARDAGEELSPVGTDYGLPDRIGDGCILHCFNWTLNQIREELLGIAQAGFTAVQTSPLQPHTGGGSWYWLYQPTNFTVGNEIGSYNDLKSLCSEADKYGIKVIVDVVANHVAGGNNGSWAGDLDSSLRNGAYFHNLGPCEDEDDRFEVTHKNIGMPDLNSEHTEVQRKVASYVASLKSAGVDGIRWDAAKHISLPSEDCGFWPAVIDDSLYNYGEILDAPAGKSATAYNNSLIREYAEYMSVTDETYSTNVTTSIRDKKLIKTNGNWLKRGVAADRIVNWGESHDTYCNDGFTNKLDQNVIDRAYAVLAARADSQTLYLSRPYEKNHNSISAARKGSTHYTSAEVAAVNRFHNAMIGKAEKYTTGAGCFVVCREGGAVIVSAKDADLTVTVPNGGLVPEGVYTEEITGTTWTVEGTTMTGRIGSSGIAVICNRISAPTAKPTEAPTAAPTNPSGTDRLLIGDTDLDGRITIIDATAIQRHLASLKRLSQREQLAADSDRDDKLTVIDATLIQRYLAGLPSNASKVGQYR